MKITTTMRVLLVALSLIMVFSLFACAEEQTTPTDTQGTNAATEDNAPEETAGETAGETASQEETTVETEAPECEHEEEIVAGKAATCTEAGLTDGKVCSKCGEVLAEQEEIAATGHKLDAGTPTKDAKCGEAGEAVFKCTNAGCDYTETKVVEALAHDYNETITTAPTCTEAGVKTVTCKRDGCTYSATEAVAATGHTEETIAGQAPTCTEAGISDGKKCTVCQTVTVEQTAVDATGHTEKAVAYIAPTTAEVGYIAHKACANCDMVWTVEGEETTLEAVAIPVITYETNYYFGVAELKDKKLPASAPHTVTVSEDRTYVRYERTAEGVDGYLYFVDEATTEKVSGQYFVMKYRTNESWVGGYAKTVEGGLGEDDGIKVPIKSDEKWHIMIIDLAAASKNVVADTEDGNYYVRSMRIDVLDEKKSSGYFDIAFAALTADLTKVQGIIADGDTAICDHVVDESETPADKGNYHAYDCPVCGGEAKFDHVVATFQYDTEQHLYVGQEACSICGGTATKEMLYTTEPSVITNNANCVTITQEDGFVRYKATNKSNEDVYFYPYMNGTVVTGQYMVIKYRLVNNGKNAAGKNMYIASAMSENNAANGGNGDGKGNSGSGNFIGDGEWHYYIISVNPETNAQFIPNADNTYSYKYARIGFTPAAFDGTCYLDIDFVAFADNVAAAEYFAYKNETKPAFTVNLDKSLNTLNGEPIFESNGGSGQKTATIELDFAEKAPLEAADSVVIGGWLCTRGGVASYSYRIVEIDGEAVEPISHDWVTTPRNRIDIYTAIGQPKGYDSTCQNGAGMDNNGTAVALDLSAYAGKTVKVEMVATTNYGAEIVFAVLSNVTVPAALTAE